jgi:hypothetical protein
MVDCILSPVVESPPKRICPMISYSKIVDAGYSTGIIKRVYLVKVYCNDGIPALDCDDYIGTQYPYLNVEINNYHKNLCNLWNGKECSLFRE